MWCSILSILFCGSTQRGALERFHVFNPVDHTTADFQNRGPSPIQRHRSSVLGLIFQRAASSVWFKQVSRIFDSFRARPTGRTGTKASAQMICKSDSYQSSCGFYLFGRAQRRFDRSRVRSATCTLQTRDEVPDGAFFLFVSKGFSEAMRLSEIGVSAEIGL